MIPAAPKYVNKPWGHELWIADGTTMPYALKRILFKAGNQTSLQVHKFKHETNYVLEGTGTLLISKIWFDVDQYVDGRMPSAVTCSHIEALEQIDLMPGIIFHVTPGHLHRVVAKTDLTFMEASSTELNDVVRLRDDTGRPDGKIESEHK
jgi:mannose-6-phosphate isomerase-like protein (cupin superfamily)